MPILYSVIARETTVLAKYAECIGNFPEITNLILSTIKPVNHKLTYTYQNYRIHYICENKLIYMCIVDDDFDVVRSFLFLFDIKKKFILTYGLQVATAIAYAMNTEFSKVLAEQMTFFSSSQDIDSISRINRDIEEIAEINQKNIDSILERGEALDVLIEKSSNLSHSAVRFRTESRNLARQMYWKNLRMYIIIVCIIIFVLYVIISISCGGLAWQKCVGKN